MTSPSWRTEIEGKQVLGRAAPFTYTMDTGNSTTWREVFAVPGRLQEVNKLSFTVDTADVYIAFDVPVTGGTNPGAIPGAGTIFNALLIPAGTGYNEENIFVGTRIIMLNATATNARIRGVAWGR